MIINALEFLLRFVGGLSAGPVAREVVYQPLP